MAAADLAGAASAVVDSAEAVSAEAVEAAEASVEAVWAEAAAESAVAAARDGAEGKAVKHKYKPNGIRRFQSLTRLD